jgi:hypothetical protein
MIRTNQEHKIHMQRVPTTTKTGVGGGPSQRNPPRVNLVHRIVMG